MRSPSAFDRRMWAVAAVAAVAAIAGTPGLARADDKQVCIAAYDQTQTLRADGKLKAAREQAAACMRDACPAFMRTDCATWLREIDASQPTVVFEVRDAAGKEMSAVRVELDGKPWLEALDGSSKPVDPGQHTFHYVLAGGSAPDETVQIREGEKNRKLSAAFQKAAASPAPPPPPPPGDAVPSPARSEEAPHRSVAPWIIGGVGLAGLAVGGILGGVVLHDKSIIDDPSQCNARVGLCTTAGASAEQGGRTLGPASTAAFIVGGVGVAVAAVWLIFRAPARSAAPAATVGLGPAMTPGGGWTLRGTW